MGDILKQVKLPLRKLHVTIHLDQWGDLIYNSLLIILVNLHNSITTSKTHHHDTNREAHHRTRTITELQHRSTAITKLQQGYNLYLIYKTQ